LRRLEFALVWSGKDMCLPEGGNGKRRKGAIKDTCHRLCESISQELWTFAMQNEKRFKEKESEFEKLQTKQDIIAGVYNVLSPEERRWLSDQVSATLRAAAEGQEGDTRAVLDALAEEAKLWQETFGQLDQLASAMLPD